MVKRNIIIILPVCEIVIEVSYSFLKLLRGFTFPNSIYVHINIPSQRKLVHRINVCKVWDDKEYDTGMVGNLLKDEDMILLNQYRVHKEKYILKIAVTQSNKYTFNKDNVRYILRTCLRYCTLLVYRFLNNCICTVSTPFSHVLIKHRDDHKKIHQLPFLLECWMVKCLLIKWCKEL